MQNSLIFLQKTVVPSDEIQFIFFANWIRVEKKVLVCSITQLLIDFMTEHCKMCELCSILSTWFSDKLAISE